MIEPLLLGYLCSGLTKPKPKRKRKSMNLFNSFQIVTIFAASPFIYKWLDTTGYDHWGILGTFWVAYAIQFIYLIGSVWTADWDKL